MYEQRHRIIAHYGQCEVREENANERREKYSERKRRFKCIVFLRFKFFLLLFMSLSQDLEKMMLEERHLCLCIQGQPGLALEATHAELTTFTGGNFQVIWNQHDFSSLDLYMTGTSHGCDIHMLI